MKREEFSKKQMRGANIINLLEHIESTHESISEQLKKTSNNTLLEYLQGQYTAYDTVIRIIIQKFELED